MKNNNVTNKIILCNCCIVLFYCKHKKQSTQYFIAILFVYWASALCNPPLGFVAGEMKLLLISLSPPPCGRVVKWKNNKHIALRLFIILERSVYGKK